jgi:hypothetical protein
MNLETEKTSQFSLCRPTPNHWCIECCSLRGCHLLGTLPDGTEGCLSHQTGNNKGLTETELCRKFVCYPNILKDPDKQEKILKAVQNTPPGRINIDNFVKNNNS